MITGRGQKTASQHPGVSAGGAIYLRHGGAT